MPMFFLLQQYQEAILTLLKKLFKKILKFPFRCSVGKGGHRHFLPFGRADLTASASLLPIRGSSLQLHGPLPRRYSNLDS